MSHRLSIADARAHIPQLVLSRHVQKRIHGESVVGRINTRLAVGITKVVGSMWCAYLFALLALVSFPAAISSHDPIIIVGQNVQAAASDARAESDHKTLLAIHTLTAQVHEIAEQQTKVLEILEERSDQGAAIGE